MRPTTCLAALLAALALAVPAAGEEAPAQRTPAAPVSEPCGEAAETTLASAIGLVATRIYGNEQSSSEVFADKHEVEASAPLLKAVAAREPKAIREAIVALVFSGTHIVRLRVTDGAKLLGDVGGRYDVAPVGGELRLHGRHIADYLLTVQDDLGYVKLVSRFLGVPVVMRVGAQTLPIEGSAKGAPAVLPRLGPVSWHGSQYEAYSFAGQSFPSGPLRISLLVAPRAGLEQQTCAQIRVNELGVVAERISRRFPKLSPSNFSSFMKATVAVTHGLVFIRRAGRQLAASVKDGPGTLPATGTIEWNGHDYGVSSFTTASTAGQIRIYQLTEL